MRLPQILTLLVALVGFVTSTRAAEPPADKSPAAEAPSAGPKLLAKSKRLLFLGDSITYAGGYVTGFEAWLYAAHPDHRPLVISTGLPSETVSGLTEDGHADGKFPRPVINERVQRVLDLVKPDLVVACYGMNCGIYLPLDDERFARYEAGMKQLKATVEQAGATFVVMTPPYFDDLRGKKPFSYDAVLGHYSDWLLKQRAAGWNVIDLHHPMLAEVESRRKTDPEFTFAPDAVHPNDAGQWFMAQRVIDYFGDPKARSDASPEAMLQRLKVDPKIYPLVREKVTILRDSYLGTAGHIRPGIAKGLPPAEADAKAAALDDQIRQRLKAKS